MLINVNRADVKRAREPYPIHRLIMPDGVTNATTYNYRYTAVFGDVAIAMTEVFPPGSISLSYWTIEWYGATYFEIRYHRYPLVDWATTNGYLYDAYSGPAFGTTFPLGTTNFPFYWYRTANGQSPWGGAGTPPGDVTVTLSNSDTAMSPYYVWNIILANHGPAADMERCAYYMKLNPNRFIGNFCIGWEQGVYGGGPLYPVLRSDVKRTVNGNSILYPARRGDIVRN